MRYRGLMPHPSPNPDVRKRSRVIAIEKSAKLCVVLVQECQPLGVAAADGRPPDVRPVDTLTVLVGER
jgi:hypothetical protein